MIFHFASLDAYCHGEKMAGRFWVRGKWLGGFWRWQNVRGDFGVKISTISPFGQSENGRSENGWSENGGAILGRSENGWSENGGAKTAGAI